MGSKVLLKCDRSGSGQNMRGDILDFTDDGLRGAAFLCTPADRKLYSDAEIEAREGKREP